MKRTRLRSRVFSITATYAVLLVGVTFVLTWRAQTAQREFKRLIESDSRLVEQLEELGRTHAGFENQWIHTAATDADNIDVMSERYRSVRQLTEASPLSTQPLTEIKRRMDEFQSILTSPNALNSSEEVQRRGRAVTAAIENEVGTFKSQIAETIRRLATNARNTMWVALAVAYIVAILGFAATRQTLLKVVGPLEDLSHAAERFADEDFSARAPVQGDLEIAQLAQSFNRMAEQLAASHDALRARARTDELTGLPNFRAFRETFAAEIERARRYRHTFGILIVDIDHFKKYNDDFGHLAGNEALQAVADAIRQTIRQVDLAARYGGEEFVAVLPEIEAQGLAVIAERIRIRVAALPPMQGNRRITVSVGGALYPLDGSNGEALFQVADERLYEAKSSGRNRVITPTATLPVV